MNNLDKIRKQLYTETRIQKERAWKEKDFKKSKKIRDEEKINYEKWKLLNGIIKATDKEKKK